jgi:hypothetical protein
LRNLVPALLAFPVQKDQFIRHHEFSRIRGEKGS